MTTATFVIDFANGQPGSVVMVQPQAGAQGQPATWDDAVADPSWVADQRAILELAAESDKEAIQENG